MHSGKAAANSAFAALCLLVLMSSRIINMQTLTSNANVRIRVARKPGSVRATIAPSRPQQATAKRAPSVNAKVQYVKPAPAGEDLFIYLYEKPDNVNKVTNLVHVETEVPFTDLRTIQDQDGRFTIERNGFQLEKLHVPSDIDWTNDEDVGFPCTILRCQPECPGFMLSTKACFANATQRAKVASIPFARPLIVSVLLTWYRLLPNIIQRSSSC